MITRIRELLETRQLSPTQFADLIGVGRPVISHILSERNKPSLEVVQKIIGAFPEISLPWLLAGTGPMLATAAAIPTPSVPTRAPEAPAPPTSVITPPVIAAAATTAPAAFPVAPVRATAVAQPSSYAQPPKFRPATPKPATLATADLPGPTTSAVEAAAIALPSPTTAPSTPPAPATVAAPAPIPELLASAQAALPPQPAFAAPVAPSESPREAANAIEQVSTPPAVAEVAAPTADSAAALSFLGEPGKAIRRIVIFYRDGSFSDYVPEGN